MASYIPKIEYVHPVNGATTITFTLPPEADPLDQKYVTAGKETRSSSGQDQFQFNYTDQSFKVKFRFLTKVILDEFFEFYNDHASKGGDFKYFPSADEVDFYTVVWGKKQFTPRRIIRDGVDFIYDISMDIRVKIS